jgi:hypothetical protein
MVAPSVEIDPETFVGPFALVDHDSCSHTGIWAVVPPRYTISDDAVALAMSSTCPPGVTSMSAAAAPGSEPLRSMTPAFANG